MVVLLLATGVHLRPAGPELEPRALGPVDVRPAEPRALELVDVRPAEPRPTESAQPKALAAGSPEALAVDAEPAGRSPIDVSPPNAELQEPPGTPLISSEGDITLAALPCPGAAFLDTAALGEAEPRDVPPMELGPPPTPPVRVVDVGLDPGHSDADVGAVGGGIREVDLNLAVALRVRELLEERGLTVAMSRLDNAPLTDFSAADRVDRIRLEQEARIAAVGKTRVYVSVHFNGHGDQRIRGTESYYNGDNHGDESRRMATAIQSSLVAAIRATGYAVPNRGVKEDLLAGKPYGHFFSLRGDKPSALVEALFLSSPQEASLLTRPEVREAIAGGIASGIAGYLSESRGATP